MFMHSRIWLLTCLLPFAAGAEGWQCTTQAAASFDRDRVSNRPQAVRVNRTTVYQLVPSAQFGKWFVHAQPPKTTDNTAPQSIAHSFICGHGPDSFGRVSCTGIGDELFVFRADTRTFLVLSLEAFNLTAGERNELSRRTDRESDALYRDMPILEIGTCVPL
jgi:hypothetical protein